MQSNLTNVFDFVPRPLVEDFRRGRHNPVVPSTEFAEVALSIVESRPQAAAPSTTVPTFEWSSFAIPVARISVIDFFTSAEFLPAAF
jgi:hypothetical protein